MKTVAEPEKHAVQTGQSIDAVKRGREMCFNMNLQIILLFLCFFLVTFSTSSKCLLQSCLAVFFSIVKQ